MRRASAAARWFLFRAACCLRLLATGLVQVQNLLQQMQGRFATMSDAIIGRSASAAPPRMQEFKAASPFYY